MSKPMAFADCLRSLREQAGLSQYALAKRSGLTKQALSRLELGEREPTWDTVQKLALALGVDCRSFVDERITLPEPVPARPVGRPRKATVSPSPVGPAAPPVETPAPALAEAQAKAKPLGRKAKGG